MPKDGSLGPTEANPLGLGLSFVDGAALVTLRDRHLADGVVLRALELELAEVEFPLDLEGGAEEFQRRSTQLVHLVLEVELDRLGRALAGALAEAGRTLEAPRLQVEKGRLVLEGRLGPEGPPAIVDLVAGPADEQGLELHLVDAAVFGAARTPTLTLARDLEVGITSALAALSGRAAQTVAADGPWVITFDPVGALLWSLMPSHGWKVPRYEHLPIVEVGFTPDGAAQLVVGAPKAGAAPRPAEATPEEALALARARQDQDRLAPAVEAQVSSGALRSAYEALDRAHDLQPSARLFELLVAVGVAEPALDVELRDRLDARLEVDPDLIFARLARAAILTRAGEPERARADYEHAARRLRRSSLRRRAGLAYRAAADLQTDGSAEQARLLEETIALRPDDEPALAGLVAALPGLGRGSAAVRAARRLANLSEDPEVELKARLTSARLLFDHVGDESGARREWDRALRISPEHPEALEGMARLFIAKGDTRRAASLLERLATQAERAADAGRAARLSMRLGDLWRPLDPDAAMARYRRAQALSPRSARPLLSMAQTAEDAGRAELALDVLDEAMPRLDGVSPEEDREALLELRLLAGRLYAEAGDRSAEAVAQLEAALALEPRHEPALEALAALHVARGDPAAASELVGARAEAALSRGEPDRAAELWAEQRALEPEARHPTLRARLLDALEAHPRHRGLLDLLVEVSRFEPAAAVTALERRLELEDPAARRGALWAELGVAYEAEGDALRAIRAHEEALACAALAEGDLAWPASSARALVELYRARRDEGRLVSALARAATFEASEETQAALHAERARLLEASGAEGEAWSAMKAALRATPDDLALLPFATSLAIAAGDPSSARELAERRLALQAEQPASARLSAYVDLAKVEEIVGDREALVRALEQAYAAADPGSDGGRRLAGRLARELAAREDSARLAALQRARRRIEGAPPTERAELALDAARHFERLDAYGDAEEEVKAVLDLAERGGIAGEVVEAALDVLEDVARRQPDPGRRAQVKVLRAQRASGEVAMRLRLEGARILEEAGRVEAAIAVLEDAGPRLDESRPLLEALAAMQAATHDPRRAAEAYAKAAVLADEDDPSGAARLHAAAAAAFSEAGFADRALSHDRALLGLADRAEPAGLDAALDRLEAHARTANDAPLLADVLERRAAAAPANLAAELLLEKADLHLGVPGQEKAALAALRAAHGLQPPDGETADAVDARLSELLMKVGLFAEQAAVLSDWAERSEAPAARAERLFRAADVYATRLRDRSMALSRAQAAVRTDPSHEAARRLRLELLRAEGRASALAEALAEEAASAPDAATASARWLEAAELVAPPGKLDDLTPAALEQALDLVRRAATAAPGARGPVEVEVRYSRALGRPDEELSALGRLVDRDLEPTPRAAVHLRRAHLLRGALGDDLAAQGELEAALEHLLEASEEEIEAVGRALPEITREAYEATAPDDLVKGVLHAQLEVTESVQDWAAHVKTLASLVERAEAAHERCALRVQAGGVLEWRLGDGAAAEREYLSALAVDPDHTEARRALSQFYVAVDRFGDLAESLGVEALVEVFEGFGDAEPPRRVAAAAEALWPELPEGSSERADVQLRLSDLYSRLEASAEVVHALELVVQTGPRPHQDEALVRLRRLFESMGRDDLLVDVLRRQAERIVTDEARAVALAELGEALEWKLGDGPGAEQEYRAALAADPSCAPARRRLAELLSAQDRFSEIGTDLGPEDLRAILERLLETGARDRERAFAAAAALAGLVEPEAQGEVWISVAEALEGSPEDETARTREALEAAAEHPASEALALERLAGLLERVGEERALADVLERRARASDDPSAAAGWRLERARRLLALGRTGAIEREAAEVEAERALRAALDGAPDDTVRRELGALLKARRDWRGLLALAGDDGLVAAQAELEASGERAAARDALRVRAAAAEGERRAAALVELVGFVDVAEAPEDEALPSEPEALYRAALEADPEHLPAREGLRALYESQGRFREIGEVLSPDALRTTLRGLEALDEGAQLLPATLALATVLRHHPDADEERVLLYVRAAALHQSEEDEDAAEHALRNALAVDPEHTVARDELSSLLVRQGRLEALADVDPALVARAAARASEIGDQEMEIRALRVLATRREGREQADTLVLVAALEKARGHVLAAEEDLTRALERDPEHALARSELESILWEGDRYAVALEKLGSKAFLRRVAVLVDESPPRLLEAVEAVEAQLDPGARAEAFELCAAVRLPGEAPDEAWRRRAEAIERAKALWDEVGAPEGALRTRLVLVDLAREHDDVDALLEALRDAAAHARLPEDKASLAIEQATLLALTDKADEARALVEPIVLDGDVPLDHRRGAARILVEDLLPPAPEPGALDPETLALRRAALEALTDPPPEPGEEAARWWTELAAIYEASDVEPERVARALEASLAAGARGEDAKHAHTLLRGLYEELGDWRGAERHAAVLAAAEDDPDLWVQVSELRVWLDDRAGAEAALQSAISLAPSHAPAHESLLRLAEQTGERSSVIERLESWASADASSDPETRLERLMRAFEIAVEAGDAVKAAELAERALDVAPEARRVEVVQSACDRLGELDALDAQVSLLTRAVSGAGSVPAPLRLMLADRLEALDRLDEAWTVLEAGLHRDVSEQDPVLERVVADAGRLAPEVAARRLLDLAERLEHGPAARRLRASAAERAEQAADVTTAREAWAAVVEEVAAGELAVTARAALVRLARGGDDPRALFEALLAAVDDAPTPDGKAARLVEAAELAARALDAPSQAEALYRRARRLVPEDTALAERFLDYLRETSRWSGLDAELREQAVGAEGVRRAELCAARAELLTEHLGEPQKAARLWREAFEADPTPARGRRAVTASYRAGSHDEALALVDRVAEALPEDDPEREALERDRAEILEALGRIDEALERLGELCARLPGNRLLQHHLRELLARHGRLGALADLLERIAPDLAPGEGLLSRLAAARIRAEHLSDPEGARSALEGALGMVEGWMGAAGAPMPDEIVPPPVAGAQLSERTIFEAPLLDLATLAASIGAADLRVSALRLYAQSLPEGLAQWRVLLLLAAAEREAQDLEAAEFTLRGVVEAVRDAEEVDPKDRAEAELGLGALLLDRGEPADAAVALERAQVLLQEDFVEGEASRAEVLVLLSRAHAQAGEPMAAMRALVQANLLDPERVSTEELDAAVEAAGPSPELAELLVRRASAVYLPAERAERLREAARVWVELGQPEMALGPRIAAYEADPSNVEDAARLEQALREAGRYGELDRLLALRLRDAHLTDEERRALLLRRAEVSSAHLGRPEAALDLLAEASARAPDPEALTRVAALAAELGRTDLEQDALARLAGLFEAPEPRRRALLAKAASLGEDRGVAALEQALELSFEQRLPVIPVAARLAARYAAREDPASLARLWVRVAGAREGRAAAAALSRAAQVRLTKLEDRRGAASAFEAACRKSPEDLGLRRAALSLAESLQDTRRALAHGQAGTRIAIERGRTEAAVSFARAQARAHAAAGRYAEELEVWRAVLELGPSRAALDDLVVRAREALPPAEVEGLLARAEAAASSDALRARLMLARARVLDDPLGRHWEAEGVREDAARLDPEAARALDATDAPGTADLSDADYRTMRSMLDRSGRWSELAELEEQQAARLPSRAARARALLDVAALHDGSGAPDARARAADALERAAGFDPGLVEAHAGLLRHQVEAEAWSAARATLERLDALGGPPWPAPELELVAADVAEGLGDAAGAERALEAAVERDPDHVGARARLARLAPNEARLAAWAALLDPLLDAEVLAEIAVSRARVALEADALDAALEHVEAAARAAPRDPRPRALRREILAAQGAPAEALLDAWLDEARVSEAPAVPLRAALELTEQADLQNRVTEVAELLAPLVGDDPESKGRLTALWRARGDSEGLVRALDAAGDVEALEPLSEAERVTLARALLRADRGEEAWRVLLVGTPDGSRAELQEAWARGALSGLATRIAKAVVDEAAAPGAALASPPVRARLRAIFGGEGELGPHALAALTRCVIMLPRERGLAERLAATLRALECAEDAAAEYRALLSRAPASLDLLEALLDVAGFEDARGPEAVRAWLVEGRAPRLPRLRARLEPEQVDLLYTRPGSALARAMRLAAPAFSALARPVYDRLERLPSAAEDPRIAPIWDDLSDLWGTPLVGVLDPEGGAAVHLEAGTPTGLAIGEALVSQASSAELRFHLARAAFEAEAGLALVEHVPSTSRHELLCRVADGCEADDLDPSDPVSALSAATRARLAELAPQLRGATDLDLARWRAAALRASARFGLAACGDLEAAVKGLDRREPRALGESRATLEARLAAVRRWGPVADLLTWLTQEGYSKLLASGGFAE